VQSERTAVNASDGEGEVAGAADDLPTGAGELRGGQQPTAIEAIAAIATMRLAMDLRRKCVELDLIRVAQREVMRTM
jgi:hypothetical protein